jgi:hypothetical protein
MSFFASKKSLAIHQRNHLIDFAHLFRADPPPPPPPASQSVAANEPA